MIIDSNIQRNRIFAITDLNTSLDRPFKGLQDVSFNCEIRI